MHYIKNIHLAGNEDGKLRRDIIYAELHDECGLVISATLEYILCRIRDLKLETYNVEVKYFKKHGIKCSKVILKDFVDPKPIKEYFLIPEEGIKLYLGNSKEGICFYSSLEINSLEKWIELLMKPGSKLIDKDGKRVDLDVVMKELLNKD